MFSFNGKLKCLQGIKVLSLVQFVIGWMLTLRCIFQLHVTQGVGQFVPTPPNGQFAYGRINEREKVCLLVVDLWHYLYRGGGGFITITTWSGFIIACIISTVSSHICEIKKYQVEMSSLNCRGEGMRIIQPTILTLRILYSDNQTHCQKCLHIYITVYCSESVECKFCCVFEDLNDDVF